MNYNNYLLEHITHTLKTKNISQSDLAKSIGTTRSDVSITLKNLHLGKSITTKKLFKILDALKINFQLKDK